MKIQDKTLSFERLPLELRDPRTKNGGSHTERFNPDPRAGKFLKT